MHSLCKEGANLKVAHFSYSDSYGAWGAAYELHKSMVCCGIKSTFFVREKTRMDDTVIEIKYKDTLQERLIREIDCLYFNRNRVDSGINVFYSGLSGLEWDDQIEKMLNEYDVFHLHWISDFLSTDNIRSMLRMDKKVVWTLHDFYPFTGGCHYPEICEGYKAQCSKCWQLKYNPFDIANSILEDKKLSYGNKIHVITASNWLKNIVKKSAVFQDAFCSVAPIGIDVSVFQILDKREQKQKFGFASDTKVILIGAQALQANVKGYGYIEKIIEILLKDVYCNHLCKCGKLKLAIFGNSSGFKEIGKIECIDFGFIEDREQLCGLYNAADVFVFPSIQETFGMTAAEAMACGTPVAAFDRCAMQEVIVDGVNGFKVDFEDCEAMACKIISILKRNFIDVHLCRKRIVDFYSLEAERDAVLSIYDRVAPKEERTDFDQTQNEEMVQFRNQCIYEIVTDTAVGQNECLKSDALLDAYNPFFVSPERKIKELIGKRALSVDEAVSIYGAGEIGKQTLQALKKRGIAVKEFFDSDNLKWGDKIEGYIIKGITRKTNENQKIIIASMAYLEIEKFLQELGYIKDKDFY